MIILIYKLKKIWEASNMKKENRETKIGYEIDIVEADLLKI